MSQGGDRRRHHGGNRDGNLTDGNLTKEEDDMWRYVVAFALVLGLGGLGSPALAQTPDLETPAVETECDHLTGAAFGLCNAYCEAQDCDEQDPERRSCEALRANFERQTGETHFPCDRFCGDGVIDPDLGEECDPPGRRCKICECHPCPPCENEKCEPCKPLCKCFLGDCTDDCTCGPIVTDCPCGAPCTDENGRDGSCQPTELDLDCACVAIH